MSERSKPKNQASPWSARLVDSTKAPRRWWQPSEALTDIDDKDKSTRLAETSLTIRRVLLLVVGYAIFSAITLTTQSSSGQAGVIVKLPFFEGKVPFSYFMVAGPLLFVGLVIYLHIFVGYLLRISNAQYREGPPFIFNMPGRAARFITAFLLYWLPWLVLMQFAYTTRIGLDTSIGAGSVFVKAFIVALTGATAFALIWLRIKRWPIEKRRSITYQAHWLVLAGVTAAVTYSLLPQISAVSMRLYPPALPPVISAPEPNLEPQTQVAIDNPLTAQAIRRDRLLERVNLSNEDLSGRDLSGRLWDRAVLRDALLRHAILNETYLREADLTGADLTGAVLRGAKLSRANLSDAVLKGADLTAATLNSALLTRANLRDAQLRHADLEGAKLTGAKLDNANLLGASGITCDTLQVAKGWDKAYRDEEFSCGEPVAATPVPGAPPDTDTAFAYYGISTGKESWSQRYFDNLTNENEKAQPVAGDIIKARGSVNARAGYIEFKPTEGWVNKEIKYVIRPNERFRVEETRAIAGSFIWVKISRPKS